LWLIFHFINSHDTIFTEQWNKTRVCISFPHWKLKRNTYVFVANTIIIFISFPLSSSLICYILPLSMCFPSLYSSFQISSSRLLLCCCCLDLTLQSNDFAMMIIWQRWRIFFDASCSTLKATILRQWLLNNLNWIWYITFVR